MYLLLYQTYKTEPANRVIFVRGDWIVRYVDPGISKAEKARHEHMFLQKGLHELGHILTPIIQDHLKSRSKSTSVRIGRHKSKEGKIMGDAGYGLEECLSGGRMFHVGSKSNKFEFTNLVLHRMEMKTKRKVNVIYEIADSYMSRKKRKFADFSLADSELTLVTPAKFNDYRKRAMVLYQPTGDDERRSGEDVPVRKS